MFIFYTRTLTPVTFLSDKGYITTVPHQPTAPKYRTGQAVQFSSSGRQVNTSYLKKSVFVNPTAADTVYSKEVMVKVAQLVDEQILDILKIETLETKTLRNISTELGFITNIRSRKSDIALRNELKTVVRYLLHNQEKGQGVCHAYVQVQGRTAGFQDLWCQHETKIGSVMQTLQESVTDPSDLVHSMKKLPKVHLCDDSCTLGR